MCTHDYECECECMSIVIENHCLFQVPLEAVNLEDNIEFGCMIWFVCV